ncbi:CGNR zinc finger domain-containing protein [Streptomyces sp. CBMA123]|uniref:CGNR zinc finger domain-containing protein n=1 Tax=Streptomyces sp. CBMA123 TaxID=1896313 RepID=UPI00398341DD
MPRTAHHRRPRPLRPARGAAPPGRPHPPAPALPAPALPPATARRHRTDHRRPAHRHPHPARRPRRLAAATSRPGRRRWCSMERCGNRHKVRALRARRETGQPPPAPAPETAPPAADRPFTT